MLLNRIIRLKPPLNIIPPLPVGSKSTPPTLEIESVWENMYSTGWVIDCAIIAMLKPSSCSLLVLPPVQPHMLRTCQKLRNLCPPDVCIECGILSGLIFDLVSGFTKWLTGCGKNNDRVTQFPARFALLRA